MAGKRMIKRKTRLPAVLVLLASVTMLTAAGGRSAAADSPGQRQSVSAAAPEVQTLPRQLPRTEERLSDPEQSAGVQDAPAEPFAPVPETDAVEDTYFEDAAFLGDSRTEGFHLYSGLTAGSYYYAVGATVESVFTKDVETPVGKMPLLDAMANGKFGKIYVMLGINELGWNKTETFCSQYAKLIERLRRDHPQAQIILQSLPPVSARQEEKKSYVNNGRIAVYNQVIYDLAEEYNCAFVDTASAVTGEDGCLRSEWNSDGVHLNVQGCEAWLGYLRTHPVEQ